MLDSKAQPLDTEEMAAWYAGSIPRSVRTIPFGGPLRSADGKGRDVDGEYFDERTDIKPHWFSERPILWHHGADPTGVMADAVLGKAINLRQEPDGWWEDFWLNAGESRLARVRSLEAKGGTLFASSTPLQTPGIRTRRGKAGHIEVWPHAESTLSTSPQNTWAIVRAAKAVLDDFNDADIPAGAFAGFLADIDDLGSDLRPTSMLSGDAEAKAGRVLSAKNEAALRAALEQLGLVMAQLAAPIPKSEDKHSG